MLHGRMLGARAAGALICGAAANAPRFGCRRPLPRRRSLAAWAQAGPSPAWDNTGGAAIRPLALRDDDGHDVRRGELNKVIWMCWTGNNPLPAHLQLCLRSVRQNSGLPVIVVTPSNLKRYVPDPHPAYEFLHLQHRADYLRCCLLHFYGGIYLDMDTICLRELGGLFDALREYDAVGYDGSQWGELIGISDMGPFKPATDLTELWFNALHAKMHQRASDLRAQRQYAFYWQEILRDIFVPASVLHRRRISTALRAHNPEPEVLWSSGAMPQGLSAALESAHIIILNNSKYGKGVSQLTEDEILGGSTVFSQLLRCYSGRNP